MLFNSIDFAIFLPIVFFIYWFVASSSIRWQNIVIVVASYVFYGWWDWRFLGLIVVSSCIDFSVGKAMAVNDHPGRRKRLLWLSILVNLGLLGYFKYSNFFLESFSDAFYFAGYSFNYDTLKIVLPVGISFYTFQTLSYTVDVYRNKMQPTKDFIGFAAFVSFFPQLVAGPIERATNLLPQFDRPRKLDRTLAVDGLRQILWGLFKKIVVADNCAEIANLIFNDYTSYSGSTLALGAVFFAFQIYGDFSGYSDIAIGTARLFGFDLMRNFAFPYFSRDIPEFWRRWHISLSTWFRDYLYIPLGGSRGGKLSVVRNVFAIFIVSGFWHGANWTFIIWGALNALYFLPYLLTNRNRNYLEIVAKGKNLPGVVDLVQMLVTFALVNIAWVFFRAPSVTDAFAYLSEIFSTSLLTMPELLPAKASLFIGMCVLIEWFGREQQHALVSIANVFSKRPVRWAFYYMLIAIILLFGGNQQEFIYFQF